MVASGHEFVTIHLTKPRDFFLLFQIFLNRLLHFSDCAVTIFSFRVEVFDLFTLLTLDINKCLRSLLLLLEVLVTSWTDLLVKFFLLWFGCFFKVRFKFVSETDRFLHIVSLECLVLNHLLSLLNLLHMLSRTQHLLLQTDCPTHVPIRNSVILVVQSVLQRVNQCFVRLLFRLFLCLLLPQIFHISFELVGSKLDLILLRFQSLFSLFLCVLSVLFSQVFGHSPFRRLFLI